MFLLFTGMSWPDNESLELDNLYKNDKSLNNFHNLHFIEQLELKF